MRNKYIDFPDFGIHQILNPISSGENVHVSFFLCKTTTTTTTTKLERNRPFKLFHKIKILVASLFFFFADLIQKKVTTKVATLCNEVRKILEAF